MQTSVKKDLLSEDEADRRSQVKSFSSAVLIFSKISTALIFCSFCIKAKGERYHLFYYFPNLGGKFPNLGEMFPNFGREFPNLGGEFPNLGGEFPNFGEMFPNFGRKFPNLGGEFPNLAESFPNFGEGFPNISVLLS